MKKNDKTALIAGGLTITVICAVIAICIISYAKTEYTTFTLTGKESVSTSDGNGNNGHEYRLYTSEGTFKVKDSWVHPRFNSSDVYGRLQADHTYNCKVYGWRIPVFSSFKNVLNCKEV